MGAKRVGQRIHVYWTDETAWFSGIVQEFDANQGYYVLYDDGDERWEGLNESYRFEGQQGNDDEEEDGEGAGDQECHPVEEQDDVLDARNGSGRGATSRATELPGSEDDDDCDDDEADDHGEDQEKEEDVDERPAVSSRSTRYPQPIALDAGEDTASEAEEDEEEDSPSVALTDVPTTYESRRVPSQQAVATATTRNHRLLPHRAILRGFVARASELPLVNRKNEPSAFVRVAFVEAGAGEVGRLQPSGLMMRCKQALSATQPSSETVNPVWNDEECVSGADSTEIWTESQSLDGFFQLQVAPPLIVSAHHQQPAWLQLKGDLLFSVYHQDVDESRRNEFIGQASLPLARIMRELLASQASSPMVTTTQYLPLENRQGKPVLGAHGEIPELVVRFQFEAQCEPVVRRPKEPTTNAAPLAVEELRQPATSRAGGGSTRSPSVAAASSARPKSVAASTNARAGAKRHQSSSEINRRKFEKQLEQENTAIARRVAEQRKESGVLAARRQQLNHQPPLKCEPKAPGVLAVAPKVVRRTHKASSQINRGKFHDELKRENKAMGKRLVERVGGVLKGEKQRPSQTNDELHWDDAKAQDKAHVADKRHVVRQEKDYLLEKAQAKYQQQNELVEQVMTLQEQVSDWKTKLFTVKCSLQRVEAMNKKDTHVRDCLRSAVERDAKRRPGASPSALSTPKASSRAVELERLLDTEDEDDDDPVIQKHKDELRELLQEASSLDSEKQRLDGQIHDLNSQEATLEDEILILHRKWQFVETKRAFQGKMAKDRATPASAAYAAQEIKDKKRRMDLTSEEEEQYKIFTAQEELMQLQLSVAVLRDRLEKGESGSRPARQAASSSSSSAACEYLREKITKRKAKLERLESEQETWRRRYEELVVDGEYDRLRAQVQELQHLLFLCQSEAKHVAAAERVAKHSKDKLSMELQKQRFQDQTETDILLKKKATPRAARE